MLKQERFPMLNASFSLLVVNIVPNLLAYLSAPLVQPSKEVMALSPWIMTSASGVRLVP
jgi:hypothetical protein